MTKGSTSVERVLGHRVDPVSLDRAVELVVERARDDRPGAYVCLTNVHTTVESNRMDELRAAVEGSYLSVPDGMPLVWLLKYRRRHASTQKVTGIEFMPLVAEAGRSLGLRHFFYGGRSGVAEAAGRELASRVPGTAVVGAISPPFTEEAAWRTEHLQRELDATKPHILWVGLGAPKQELWMARHAARLDVPIMVGVGAAFDFLAGTKRTCPRSLSRLGLEWLFRLASEPRRLWRRYLIGNARFLYLLLRHSARKDPP